MENVNVQNLKTNDEMQDNLIKEAELIVENGMGGLESFMSQFNDELLLGLYTIDTKMASIIGLKDMKAYVRPTDASDSSKPNYKYKRITHFGAEKVTSKEFPDWIREKYSKICVEIDNLDVKYIGSPNSNYKTFEVLGIQVTVGNKGSWFFTNEAAVAAGMIGEKPEAELFADKFIQFAKMGELQTKNAKTLASSINAIEENLQKEGKSIQEYLTPKEYLETIKSQTSAEFISFTPEWFNKVKELLVEKINNVENDICNLQDQILDLRSKLRNTSDSEEKMDLQDQIDDLDHVISKKSSEKERYNSLLHKVKDDQKAFDDKIKSKKVVDTSNLLLMRDYTRNWNTAMNNSNFKMNDKEAFEILVDLGIFVHDRNYYPNSDDFEWMYSACGIFPKPGKKGTASSTFNKFGQDFLTLIFKRYFYTLGQCGNDKGKAKILTKDYIAKRDLKKLSNVEAVLYGGK